MSRLEVGLAAVIGVVGCTDPNPYYGLNPCDPHTAIQSYNRDSGTLALECINDGGMRVPPADLIAADQAIFGDQAGTAADLRGGTDGPPPPPDAMGDGPPCEAQERCDEGAEADIDCNGVPAKTQITDYGRIGFQCDKGGGRFGNTVCDPNDPTRVICQ